MSPHESRWIPAHERLPDRPGRYLVFAESADPEKPLIVTAWFAIGDDPSDHGWHLVPAWAEAVSHWMPLPEPPRTGPLGRRPQPN